MKYKAPEADLVLLSADPLLTSDDNELAERDDVSMNLTVPDINNI